MDYCGKPIGENESILVIDKIVHVHWFYCNLLILLSLGLFYKVYITCTNMIWDNKCAGLASEKGSCNCAKQYIDFIEEDGICDTVLNNESII